jgi:4-oxalocrotonate tautomerase family enzyme
MPTVIIYWSPGRTDEQRAEIISNITDTLVTHGNARREDVLIIFQEIQPGNAGRAGHLIAPPKPTAEPMDNGATAPADEQV